MSTKTFPVNQCPTDNSEWISISEWWIELTLREAVPRFHSINPLSWAISWRVGPMRSQVAAVHSMISLRRRVFGAELFTIWFSFGMISLRRLTGSLIPNVRLRERSISETMGIAPRLNALAPSHFDRGSASRRGEPWTPQNLYAADQHRVISFRSGVRKMSVFPFTSWRTMIFNTLRTYAESVSMAVG
jgi:hypothetical protein